MISIIIPCLNEEKFLPRLLKSIKSQDYKDYEIIVSDGNSEDKTRQIAKRNGYKVIISKKRSPAHQRNEGAKKAKGDILIFIDADSILHKGFLSDSVREFTDKGLDGSTFYVRFNSNKLIFKLFSLSYNFFCFLAQYIKPISLGAGMMAKKKVHNKIKGFDESLFIGEDHDYAQKIAKIGRFSVVSPKMLYSVRRFEKEGLLKTQMKWLYCVFYFFIFGKIRKRIIKYKYGKY